MIKSFEELKKKAKTKGEKKLVVVCAEDKTVLKASMSAKEAGLISPILVGDKKKILELGRECSINIDEKYIDI